MMTASLIGLAASPIRRRLHQRTGAAHRLRGRHRADAGAGRRGVGVDGAGAAGHSSSPGGVRCFRFLIGRFLLSSWRPPVWRGAGPAAAPACVTVEAWPRAPSLTVGRRRHRFAMRCVRLPPERRQEHREADDVGQRHVPAVPQPPAHRPGLGEHVGHRHAGRRAEPDHRAAEADRVGEHAPVVAALPKRQRGERDVVEHRRDEAEAEGRHPRRAAGSRSTGIIEAASTSDSRNTEPVMAAGSTDQSGRLHGRGGQDRGPQRHAEHREGDWRAPAPSR